MPVPSNEQSNELRSAANRAVMNKEFEAEEPSAPAGYDMNAGVMLQVSQRDQRENSVLSRTAFNIAGQLFVVDTVMKSNGDTEEIWRRGKKPLAVPS